MNAWSDFRYSSLFFIRFLMCVRSSHIIIYARIALYYWRAQLSMWTASALGTARHRVAYIIYFLFLWIIAFLFASRSVITRFTCGCRSLGNRNKSAYKSSKLWIWQGNIFGFLRIPVNAGLCRIAIAFFYSSPAATWAWAAAPKWWCQLRHAPSAHSIQIHKHLAGRVCKTAPQSFCWTTYYMRHVVLVKLSRSSSTPVKCEPTRWRAGHRRLWSRCFGRNFHAKIDNAGVASAILHLTISKTWNCPLKLVINNYITYMCAEHCNRSLENC